MRIRIAAVAVCSLLAVLVSAAQSVAGGGAGPVTLVSSSATGVPAVGQLIAYGSTPDGSTVAFSTAATNLVTLPPGSGTVQVYAKNTATGALSVVSATSDGVPQNATSSAFPGVTVSADGRYVVFDSSSDNLDPSNRLRVDELYVKDLLTGQLREVSTSSAGVPSDGNSGGGALTATGISADGNLVVFASMAGNFDPNNPGKVCSHGSGMHIGYSNCTPWETYVKNLATGTLTLLAPCEQFNVNGSAISADGSKVFFITNDSLVPADTDRGINGDLYREDLTTGAFTLVSTALPSGTPDDSDAVIQEFSVSADGNRVAITGSDPASLSGGLEVFLKDIGADTFSLVSKSADGTEANAEVDRGRVSADGAYVSFDSEATNLDPADTDSNQDVEVVNLATGDLTLASRNKDGGKSADSTAVSYPLSGGGGVLLEGALSNTPGATGPFGIYLKQLLTDQPPAILSAATATAGLRVPFDQTITTSGYPVPSIAESGALPSGVTFVDNGDGTADLAGTAPVGSSPSYPITITATNGVGSPAVQQFVLSVSGAPSAPGFVAPAADTETFGVPFSYTVTTTGYPLPRLTRTGALPPGITFAANADGTATISGTAAKAAAGVYAITLTAKSSAGTTSETFSLTITKAPTINHVPTVTAVVGTPMTPLTITAKGYDVPTLAPNGLPGGLTFTDDGNGTATIAGTPDGSTGLGSLAVTVVATNSYGQAAQAFTVNVQKAPGITSQSSANATVGQPFSFQVVATGFPAPRITRSGGLPKGITWDATSDTFSGTPKAKAGGSYAITLTAKNKVGMVTQTFTLDVAG